MPISFHFMSCHFLYPFLSFSVSQKQAQLSEDNHLLLHDCVCLWIWLRERLAQAYPSHEVDKYTELFEKGMLGKTGRQFYLARFMQR